MGPASPSPTFDQDHSTDTPMAPSEEKPMDKETTVEDALAPPVLDSQDVAQTPQQKRKEWIQFAALCLAIYVAGWNDATVGPLLPRLQEVYHVCPCSICILPELTYIPRLGMLSYPLSS